MRVHWLFEPDLSHRGGIFTVYTVSNMIRKYLYCDLCVCVCGGVFQKVLLHQTDTNKCILFGWLFTKQTNKQTYTCPACDIMSRLQSIGRKKQIPQIHHCNSAGNILHIFRSLLLKTIVVMFEVWTSKVHVFKLWRSWVTMCQRIGWLHTLTGDQKEHLYQILQCSKAVCFVIEDVYK